MNYLAMTLALVAAVAAGAADEVTCVKQPALAAAGQTANYVTNRAPLVPTRLVRLPIGSIEPRGWVRGMLADEAKGMTGRLAEISPWLKWDGNAWADPKGQHSGWEELPYWLKGYGDLGYVLKDQVITGEARKWIEAVLASAEPDGWFGPQGLKKSLDGHADLWPHMVMLNILQSFHEATGDPRVIPFMTSYFKWQAAEPAGAGFVAGYWPKMRVGDNIESVLWVYNRTGEAWLLDLARKLHEHSAPWNKGVANWHGVNLTQGFREPAMIWQLSGQDADLAASEHVYNEVMRLYGQTAGGGFGADENCRPGYTDPRQGFETCSIVEGMHSFQMLARMTANPLWADRCEELAFNTLPAALTPDQKGLRYLTAANEPQSDHVNHAPGIQNGGTMLSYSPWETYRCCQHNVSHGWPYYAEECWLASADGGLCASLYVASAVTARVADNRQVTLTETTDYPFSETVELKVATAEAVSFPLYLRIPRWCEGARLAVNGKAIAIKSEPLSYLKVAREWRDGDTVTLTLPQKTAVRTWAAQKGAVTVDHGPLSFSLKIGENWVEYGNRPAAWPDFDLMPTTPWNYGLELDAADPTRGLEVVRAAGPLAANPFTHETAPISIKAKARRIPQWGFDRTGLCAVLQQSPAKSTEPTETVTLIPMGAARLRIAVFPTVSPNGTEWTEPGQSPITASHCFDNDTVEAVADGREPANSNDHDIPRMTWWDHRGTNEWLEYGFGKTPRTVGSVSLYWFDDTGAGQCRVPASWKLLYRDGDQWKPVETTEVFGVAKDKYNTVSFKPVATTVLRVEVKLQDGVSGGVLEWKVAAK
ncbi:MAG: glycoside hydrolase family 127 protein [Armatimonadetes bacterium]|nr:glycoside hydrolase family 127 protein [Armatimonadota bacterium]